MHNVAPTWVWSSSCWFKTEVFWMALVNAYSVRNLYYLWMSNFLCLPFHCKKWMYIWLNYLTSDTRCWGSMATCLQCPYTLPFVSVCSGPGWRGHTGTGESLIWPGKAIPHSCTEEDLVKLTNLSFGLCQNRCVNWGWRTSPTNMNAVWSWIRPLQPAASGYQEWLSLLYVADMRQLQACVIANFHMASLLVWKGHQKEKIKKFRTMWKEKETAICSRSGFRGAAGLSPSLAPAEDFVLDPFTLQPAAY